MKLGERLRQRQASELETQLRITSVASLRELERQHDQHYSLERLKALIVQCVMENQPIGRFTLDESWVDPNCPEHPPRFDCHRDHWLWLEFVEWLAEEALEIQPLGWDFTVRAK